MKRETLLPPYAESLWLRHSTLIVILEAAILLLPFLGMALFHSKGEPREAIVAVSMLQTGDWILPVSNGDVIPYKPPLLAWCIALLAKLLGGEVTEYISRMPSALALIALTVWTFRFYVDNGAQRGRAMACATILLTSFEVYRAGMACRVDMLLTFFMVGALFTLYNYWKRGMHGFPVAPVLMMSGAMLSKGPVGVLLPCAVAGLFMLVRGVYFWRVFSKLLGIAIASCVIPMIWYVGAYARGGEEFLRLALEENFGRLTGTMSYASHENPVWYNFQTVLLGMLPYTLLVLFSMLSLHRIKVWTRIHVYVQGWWRRFRALEPAECFTIVCFVVIFVFYCIPKSKRSVYLLPVYPFLAWWVAGYGWHLVKAGSRAISAFMWSICLTAITAYVAYVVVQCGWFPYSLLHGRHALEQAMMVTSLYNSGGVAQWVCVSLSTVMAAVTLLLWRGPKKLSFPATLTTIWLLYIAFGGTYQPGIINAKSDRAIAEAAAKVQPEGPIYAHVSTDMLRFFTADFYTADRVRPFELDNPESGVMLIGVEDGRKWLPEHADRYEFQLLKHFRQRSCDVRQEVLLLRFQAK